MKAENSQQTMSREPPTQEPPGQTSVQTLEFRLENRHFSPLLGTLGVPSRRQSKLSMSLQQHEIGPGACPSSLPGNLVAQASGKRHIEFRLFFTI